MKAILTSALLSILYLPFYAQVPVSQVEGFLEVYIPTDDNSLYIGKDAGQNSDVDTSLQNTFVGSFSGELNTKGGFNLFLGAKSGRSSVTGFGNVFLGWASGESNFDGGSNTYIGNSAGRSNQSGFRNTFLGSHTGRASSGSNNVFIGYNAGYSSKTNHNLYIANSRVDSSEALIYGEFDNGLLRVNGDLHIASNAASGNSRLLMKGVGGQLNEVIRYAGDENDVVMGSVSGSGGKLYFRSDSKTNMALIENGNLGIGVLSPTEKLHVNGRIKMNIDSVSSTGGSFDLSMTSAGVITKNMSDLRLKNNVTTLYGSLNKVLNLRGVSFLWNEDPKAGLQLGLVAQEVLEVIPEIVHQNHDGMYSVDYSELTGVFVEAFKEQQEVIDDLTTQNEALLERMARLEKMVESLIVEWGGEIEE